MRIINFSDSLVSQRDSIVSDILVNKKLSALFARDVQYLAIAIIDKLITVLSTDQL